MVPLVASGGFGRFRLGHGGPGSFITEESLSSLAVLKVGFDCVLRSWKSGLDTKPYKFIEFGAMDATKPYKFIGFGVMDATKPYKFIWFGTISPLGGPWEGSGRPFPQKHRWFVTGSGPNDGGSTCVLFWS